MDPNWSWIQEPPTGMGIKGFRATSHMSVVQWNSETRRVSLICIYRWKKKKGTDVECMSPGQLDSFKREANNCYIPMFSFQLGDRLLATALRESAALLSFSLCPGPLNSTAHYGRLGRLIDSANSSR